MTIKETLYRKNKKTNSKAKTKLFKKKVIKKQPKNKSV